MMTNTAADITLKADRTRAALQQIASDMVRAGQKDEADRLVRLYNGTADATLAAFFDVVRGC